MSGLSGAFTVVCLTALFSLAAWAQPDDSPRWGKEQVETIIIGKYSTELNLTPEQAERFFPRFRQFQNQAEELQRAQMGRREELERFSQEPGADQGKLNQILAEQTNSAQRLAEIKQQFLSDVSGFLTPQQVSRCSILMDDLPRRVHDYIHEQKRAGRSGEGYAPRGGDVRGGRSGDHPPRRGR